MERGGSRHADGFRKTWLPAGPEAIQGGRADEVASPADDAHQAVADVRGLMESGAFQAVMPLNDDSMWLHRAAANHGAGDHRGGTVGGAADLALNTGLQLDAARRAGFHVSPTQQLHSVEDLVSVDALSAVVDALPAVPKSARPIVERAGVLLRSD